MDRNREVRRTGMAAANGLSRRRHRSNSLRDSPEEDGPVELQEPARLRDRGLKKDRDRGRDRSSRSSKRRRAERLMQGSNREDGGEETSEESANDEEDDDDDEGAGGGVRMLQPNPAVSIPSSLSSHHNHHQQQQRKSFPPSTVTKVFRAAPSWKATDEMMGVSVPRKARSASTKRSHESWTAGVGVGGEPIHRQASTSPVRPNPASTSTPTPAPTSPSSSNASARKKMKHNGPKLRPPKSSSKSYSSNPEELEIEIAEVLYGLMTQSQGPSKKDAAVNDLGKFDLTEVNKSSSDAKSRVSSPISNSPSSAPQSSPMLLQNSSSSAPLSAVAPKRKRPRQVSDDLGSYSARKSPINSISVKVEMDQSSKAETSSASLEKNLGSVAENGGTSHDLAGSQVGPPPLDLPLAGPAKPEGSSALPEVKPAKEEAGESRDVGLTTEAATSPKKESPAVRPGNDCEEVTTAKANSAFSEMEIPREEKFQIDLMAPPPLMRSSPEREGDVDFVTAAEHKSALPEYSSFEPRPSIKDKDDDKAVKSSKNDAADVAEPAEKKAKATPEQGESEKPVANRERNVDLQLDLEKPERNTVAAGGNKLRPSVHKQPSQQKIIRDDPPMHSEKTAPSIPLPMPIAMAGWPGGLPPMGYGAPLQGVVSMDGSTVPSAPLQPLFSQPWPKRCATHCHIARNIHYMQQLMKKNPFWHAAAVGSAPMFGAKPCNLNVVPSPEFHGRTVNAVQDKGQGLTIFPNHPGKDKTSQAGNNADTAQRKQQFLIQQALSPGAAPSNIMHGPAFIFPLSQQQAAAAAAVASIRPGSVKPSPATGGVTPPNASNPASLSGSAPSGGGATAVSFNYPNVPGSETQYLAILQNNGYPFPIPAVGAAPSYRGTHPQAIPYFNGSFYSSQMIHASQLQQQQQQQQQSTLGHQNASKSSGSSSSQKHLQGQQQRPQGNSTNSGTGGGNMLSFPPAPKDRPSQLAQQQQRPHQTRPHETDGGEDSPLTADNRVSRATMNVYGQNFAVPIHPQNFALITPPSALAGPSAGSSQGDKKQQNQSQQQVLKGGLESLPKTFAMSFAPINGTSGPSAFDISSIAQSHAVLQNLPDATRHGYQIVAAATAAQVAQQKKNYRVTEEGKIGDGDSSAAEDEKKGVVVNGMATLGQSIAFSRPDLADASASNIPGTTVIDSSNRSLNLVSAPTRASSRSVIATATGNVNASNSQVQAHLQFQQQQIMQLQKQQHQHLAAAAARNKTATSNGNVYSEHLTTTSSANKFSSPLSAFPQNLVQSSNTGSLVQSPQWKNPARTATPQGTSSLAASSISSLKNLPQQQARTQQSHTQISFGGGPKTSMAPQSQQVPNNQQSPSPPLVVGSPTTSSISKGASGSPRTAASASTGNKTAQPSTLSSQQPRNSTSVPSRKSSPVGRHNVTSILGNPNISTSPATGANPQIQQQQLPKQMVHPQLFFNPALMQSASANSTSSAASGYYLQRWHPDQQQSQPAHSAPSSSGMLSLCPVTISSAAASDVKAAAAVAPAATANSMKVGDLPSQSILHPAQFTSQSSGNSHQLMPAGFSYVHTVPAAVQVKPTEQKQPADCGFSIRNGNFLTRQ